MHKGKTLSPLYYGDKNITDKKLIGVRQYLKQKVWYIPSAIKSEKLKAL